MKSRINFKIITPERTVYQDEVLEITLPTESGEITIFPTHAPLVTIAKTGEIRIRKKDVKDPIPFSLSGGIVEVRSSSIAENLPTEVIVLADRSELASEINLERAKEAYDRALKLTEEKSHLSDLDFARFEAMLDKEANRIKIYTKWYK